VFNVLLQVLDDGRLTDGQGRTVDFKNTLVIMTSNVGSQVIAASGVRPGDTEAYEAMKRQVTDALRLQFRPEFLNRVDEVIVFHALTEADLAAIVELLVADLQRRLATQDLTLELTPAARALIAREGTDPTFGARPLKRTIQRLVENPLARALIEGRFKAGQAINVDADAVGSTLVFSADGESVVADAAERRDARRREAEEEPVGAGAGGGSKRRRSVLDLPDTEPGRGDGGSRPN
jgi:ATP-dependent Clp protease ATP-binding subunit ClpA